MTKSRGILAPRHHWTAEQLAVLKRDYPHVLTSELAARFGVKVGMASGVEHHPSWALPWITDRVPLTDEPA